MKEKKLLIVERSNAFLDKQVEQVINENNEQSDSIVLTGLFTSFNTKNRNGRIYESSDFLPYVDALREQMNSHRLLGELDHPHGFEISLGNVSHVVESLEYDPQQNAIVGKIRLLNTSKGKEAQALVRDGVPLNISSRAAGTVDESGHVRLQQLFTYDLVADPGFANAQLKRVNESYGFGDDEGIDIYDITEVSEDANTNLDPGSTPVDFAEAQVAKNEDTLNKTNMEDNNNSQNYISYADFQKYTEHLSEIITDLQSAIDNIKTDRADDPSRPTQAFDAAVVDNSQIADLIAKVGELESIVKKPADQAADDQAPVAPAEDEDDVKAELATVKEAYENLKGYTKYLAETLDKSIVHNDYLVEEVNKIISHNNYLVENLNNVIKHNDYLVEKMNQMVSYENYLAENINDTISYQEYIAEHVDKTIDYANMLAEEQNKTIAYANYLGENQNKMIEYQDYIVEEVNKMSEGLIEEKKETKTPETAETEATVNEAVETPVEEPVVENVPAFDHKAYRSSLSEKLDALRAECVGRYEAQKKVEEEALAESKKAINTNDFNLINYMPARLVERWSKLSDNRKKEILAESKMFVISNQASAELFWNSRDMREKQIEIQKIDEAATAAPAQPVNENAPSDERLQAMKERIQRNLGRY